MDRRNCPNYTVSEVAGYLRIPASTVRAWAAGHRYPVGAELRHAQPLFKPAQSAPLTLSFWNLIEVYVLVSIRRRHQVTMQRVRKAIAYVGNRLGHRRPLIDEDFYTNGVDLFVEKYAQLINVSQHGQTLIREALEGALERIDRDVTGLAARLKPWLRQPCEPAIVEIDPERAFGRPVLIGTAIPTEVLSERFVAGDPIGLLARDYRLAPAQVEDAIRWEHRPVRPPDDPRSSNRCATGSCGKPPGNRRGPAASYWT